MALSIRFVRVSCKNLLDDTLLSSKNSPVWLSETWLMSARVAGRQPSWRRGLPTSSTASRPKSRKRPSSVLSIISFVYLLIITFLYIYAYFRLTLIKPEELRVPLSVPAVACPLASPASMVSRGSALSLQPCRAFTLPQSGP